MVIGKINIPGPISYSIFFILGPPEGGKGEAFSWYTKYCINNDATLFPTGIHYKSRDDRLSNPAISAT